MKTIEERRAIVEPLLQSTMVQTKPMKPGTCQNRVIDGCCTSYEFQIDNLSYDASIDEEEQIARHIRMVDKLWNT